MLEINVNFKTVSGSTTDYTKIKSIDRIHCEEISYSEFFSNYMLKNIPVIITSISDHWPCTKWTRQDEEHSKTAEIINFSQILKEIPDMKVPVANCSKQYFNSHEKIEMNFHNFLDYWKTEPKDNLLYLKDWHLRKELPQYNFYTVPKFFASDWLNEILCEDNKDDYKFVYMGPKGTWTSWSTNIVGQKKWIFLTPGEEKKLEDKLGNLPFSITEEELNEKDAKFFVIVQNPGEAIFVPSGWFHQVFNLKDTISINHNWFNGTQINCIWNALENNLSQVEKEIDDCRDMENFNEHCQVLLKASFGMNFQDFLQLLQKIVEKTLNKTRSFEGFTYGDNHLRFDLDSVNNVLETMEKSIWIKDEDTFQTIQNIKKLIECNG
uniref:Jumonji domain-containing protein 4 n=1 Tax=Phlebotomus papatasi TaxID=29031 RepID=A0A1B0DNP0_PHLPP